MDMDSEWELVMPFITCLSQGGVHDDVSYMAGYECGLIDAELEFRRPKELERVLHYENLGMLDLIAMRNGYAMDHMPWSESDAVEWANVIFKRIDD